MVRITYMQQTHHYVIYSLGVYVYIWLKVLPSNACRPAKRCFTYTTMLGIYLLGFEYVCAGFPYFLTSFNKSMNSAEGHPNAGYFNTSVAPP